MRKLNIFILFFSISTISFSQSLGDYQSYSLYGFGAGGSNYKYETIQGQIYGGVGADYSFSYSDDYNFFAGLSFMQYEMNYPINEFKDCNSESGDCFLDLNASVLFIPLGFEIYANREKSRYRNYFRFSLIPTLSFKDERTITRLVPDPESTFQIPEEEIVPYNGVKLQDLYFKFGLGSEISIYNYSQMSKIKDRMHFFFEPFVSHSLLFNLNDNVAPNYFFGVDIGLRYRIR